MNGHFNRLASEALALLRTARIRRPNSIMEMGINVSPVADRVDQWWSDLAAFCGTFWSATIEWKTESKGHLFFSCTGGAGTRLSVLMTSGGALGILDVVVDIKHKKGATKTVRFKTTEVMSIRDIVYRIDKASLEFGRSQGTRMAADPHSQPKVR